jgi:hypothetical protein
MSTSADRSAAVEKEKGAQAAAAVAGGSKPPPKRRTSASPTPRRGRSLIRGGGEIVVRERVIRDGGNTRYPTLTRTNYAEWAMVMRVQLQAAHLWDVIEYGAEEEGDDRAALAALLRAVPPELVRTIAVKDCAKTAWETIKTMRLGSERIREAKAQTRRREWEELRFKPGETIEDFALRLTAIVNDLELLGDPIDEYKAVTKYLRAVPRKYRMMSMAIEQTVDLRTLTVEDLTGRFTAAEEGYDLDDEFTAGVGKLLLTEEEWAARQNARGGSTSGGEKKGKQQGKPKSPGSDGTRPSHDGGGSSGSGERRKGNCRYCGKPGHWAKECRKAQRDREQKQKTETANLVQPGEEHQGGLLMAVVSEVVAPQAVFLNEEKVIPVPSPDGVWFFDTGASSHMTGERHMFAAMDDTVHGTVKFGDGSLVAICGRGTVVFRSQSGEQRALANVFYIPSLKSNIISVGQLDEGGCAVSIKRGVMTILDPGDRMLARVMRTATRLYTGVLTIDTPSCLLAQGDDVSWRWHARMGHLHFRALRAMSSKQMVRGIPAIDRVETFCDGCALGKHHRTLFPQASAFRAEHGLELVHTDLCGPITPASPSGEQYFLLVVDDHSRFMWLELLRCKSEAFERFKKVQRMAEAEGRCKLRAFRSDRGGEFNSTEFMKYCEELGVKHYTTAPYSPQQNGVVERRNQSVVEMARCLIKSMGMPSYFWAEAVTTAVYILNRAPTRSLDGVTPYEAWHGRKPNVQHLRTFGCTVHVKKVGPGITKLSDRSTPMVFVGYEQGSKAYRVYDPATKKVQVTRDVIFEESRPWNWNAPGALSPCSGHATTPLDAPSARTAYTTFTVVYPTENGGQEVDSGDPPASPATPPTGTTATPSPRTSEDAIDTPPGFHTPPATRSINWATPPTHDDACDASGPVRYRHLSDILDEIEEDGEHVPQGHLMLSAEEPRDVNEALDDASWKAAMDDEMNSIRDNNTWEFSSLPAGHKAIGLKWVYKVKRDPEGAIVKHKARLVAKGYSQRKGVDFEEVVAPVARMETVRLFLALAAHSGWEVHHMDVKSAFLNGELEEEVYVAQPPGYIAGGKEHQVLRLKKALYGLRQAPRAWYAKLHDTLSSLGFARSPLEHVVYRRGNESSFLLVGVYVDDLIITGTEAADITVFKDQMQKLFKMSDLGLLSYYLGIEVTQAEGEIKLCQRSYAAKIIEMAGMSDCNSCQTPMECRLKLIKDDGSALIDATLYRSVIGSLRYLVNSRPDLHTPSVWSVDSWRNPARRTGVL